AQELADDLGRFLAGEPIHARPPSIPFAVRHWFRQNLRATGWTVGVGLASGLLISCIGLFYWTQLAANVRDAYAVLPGVNPPWVPLPIQWSPPTWLGLGAFLLMLGVAVSHGFVVALIVRPQNTAADVAIGAGSGLVAGLTFFVCAIGPMFNNL